MLTLSFCVRSCFPRLAPRIATWLPGRTFSCSSLLLGSRWTKDELATLLHMKTARKGLKETLEMLPGRTLPSVKGMWSKVGPRDEKGEMLHLDPRYLTAEEYSLLNSLQQSGLSFKEIAKRHFPTRSAQDLWSFYSNYTENGLPTRLHKSPWDTDELERLRRLRKVEKCSVGQIASMLGRSRYAVRERLRRVQPMGRKRGANYSSEEDATIIRVSRNKGTPQDFEAALPGRSLCSIRLRWTRLNETRLRRTPLQTKNLRKQVMQMREKGLGSRQIAESLEISQQYVCLLAAKASTTLVETADEESHSNIPAENFTSTTFPSSLGLEGKLSGNA